MWLAILVVGVMLRFVFTEFEICIGMAQKVLEFSVEIKYFLFRKHYCDIFDGNHYRVRV